VEEQERRRERDAARLKECPKPADADIAASAAAVRSAREATATVRQGGRGGGGFNRFGPHECVGGAETQAQGRVMEVTHQRAALQRQLEEAVSRGSEREQALRRTRFPTAQVAAETADWVKAEAAGGRWEGEVVGPVMMHMDAEPRFHALVENAISGACQQGRGAGGGGGRSCVVARHLPPPLPTAAQPRTVSGSCAPARRTGAVWPATRWGVTTIPTPSTSTQSTWPVRVVVVVGGGGQEWGRCDGLVLLALSASRSPTTSGGGDQADGSRDGSHPARAPHALLPPVRRHPRQPAGARRPHHQRQRQHRAVPRVSGFKGV
jgi:hypothetical protein